jgi:hypothetical protein
MDLAKVLYNVFSVTAPIVIMTMVDSYLNSGSVVPLAE